MLDEAKALWARTQVRVWPERYMLVSLPPGLWSGVCALAAGVQGTFAGIIRECQEVSLTIEESHWRQAALRSQARSEAGPYRVITLDVAIELGACGYLAPAAARLAQAGVSLIPQCAYLKDHLLIREQDIDAAAAVLKGLVAECSAKP